MKGDLKNHFLASVGANVEGNVVPKHRIKMCDVLCCPTEASYWVPLSGTTFYLCTGHMNEIEGKDEWEGYYNHIDPQSGNIIHDEIGVYSCNEACNICNN